MSFVISRRNLIKGLSATALASEVLPKVTMAQAAQSEQAEQPGKKPWWLGNGMPQESATTPKIADAISLRDGVTDEAIRGVVQIGVYHVLSGGPRMPWTG